MLPRALLTALLLAAPAGSPEELDRRRNLGKAFFENPTTHPQAVQEFRKALALAPDSARERFNLGVALLANGQTAEGIAEIERVQKQDPSIPHTWFNLGVQYKRAGDYERSQKQFEKFLTLVPQEPVAHYNMGTLHKLANRAPEAIAAFERAMALDPNLAAPHFQLYNLYRQAGRREDAAKQLQLFQKTKEQNANAAVAEDMEWSFYSEVLDPVDAETTVADGTSPREWKFLPKRVTGPGKTPGGMLAMDVQGDGRPDLVFWSGGQLQALTALAPVAIAQGVEFAAAGDANNDGFADLAVLGAEGPALLMNARGRFTRKPLPAPAGRYNLALWLDYDHDYDLDLLLFGDRNALLRNQGESGFADRTADFPFEKGSATGAVTFRLVADSKGFDFAVGYRDRPAVLYQDKLAGVYEARAMAAIPAGAKLVGTADADHNGSMDLLFESEGGAHIAYNLAAFNDGRNLRFEAARVGDAPLALADWENRGVADAIAGGKTLRQDTDRRWIAAKPLALPASDTAVAADFNGDGRTDLATMASDGAVQLLTNQTVTPNAWLRVGITGVKNLKLAYGSEVEVKAGSRYQKKVYQGFPLTFGMRGNKQADAVRITWPNGLIQNEANQFALRPLVFKEAQRLSGSCPQVWTWNGREFEYVTDVLGVAPLGASAGDGEYFPVDSREYIQLPAMQPRNGAYEVRLTEELSEVAYIDRAELLAIDHPADHDIVLNEKFQSPPYPELRIHETGKRRGPAGRRDVELGDGWRALELDFGPEPLPAKPLLVLHGWVDWADGSVFRNRSQQKGRELAMPSLEAMEANGQWRTVLAEMGMPAGKPKWIAVELPEAAHRLRIKSNLALFWNGIFLADVRAAEPKRLPLRLAGADLGFRGFSRARIHPERKEPEMFFYPRPLPVSPWNPTPGMYTRYGDTLPLLGDADDRYVIMGSGDELTLRFEAGSLPPLAPGMRRSFVLGIDGWAKDRDANTAYSQTVEPLPFRGMSRYPYPVSERFPDTEAHRAWRSEYNTRPALRLIRPLKSD